MAESPEELAALADKYDALLRLRTRRDAGGADPPREELRQLARQFPGCLRELDTLVAGELGRRARAARAAAAGGDREPWMGWVLAFHRLMTAALLVKGELAARRPRSAAGRAVVADDLARRAERQAGATLDPRLLADFARPPAGRLAPLVIAEVARRFGVTADEMRRCLFPHRHPPGTDQRPS
jgi:hypothetical protein